MIRELAPCRWLFVLAGCAALAALCAPVRAQDDARLEALEKRVDVLEQDSSPPADGTASAEADELVPEEPAAPPLLEISGQLSVRYTWNAAAPASRTNRQRVFDIRHDSFEVALLDVVLAKGPTDELPVGFRADLGIGEDAAIFQAVGFDDDDNFELQQAYGVADVDTLGGVTVKLGKWVSPCGAEVIESGDNWNTSRSYLFGFAAPGTHTGVHASTVLGEDFTVGGAVVNGWDNVEDQNDAKTGMLCLGWKPRDRFSVALNGCYGAEQPDDTGNHRALIDLILAAGPFAGFSLMLNADYGREEEAALDGGSAIWQGIALYGRYEFLERFALAARAEVFDDEDGARLGVDGQTVREGTLTLSYRYESLELRLEARHDISDERVFDDSDGLAQDDRMTTLAFETIVRF